MKRPFVKSFAIVFPGYFLSRLGLIYIIGDEVITGSIVWRTFFETLLFTSSILITMAIYLKSTPKNK